MPEPPSIPASRAIHVILGAIDIAAEELKPKYMAGYGDVPETVATELNGIVGELSGLIGRFDRFLSEGIGEDLKARLNRLEQAGNDLELLEKIEGSFASEGWWNSAPESPLFWTARKIAALKSRSLGA